MKRLTKIFAIITLAAMPSAICAQNKGESFDEFRKSILDNFSSYRAEVLSQYGKYLDSLWVEYPQFAGVERNPFPKPKDIPVAQDKKPKPTEIVPPTPDITPDVGGTPTQPAETDEPLPVGEHGKLHFSFYGLPLSMYDTDYVIPDNLSRTTVSDLWTYMYSSDFQEPVIKEIKRLAEEMNLNDYLKFELTKNYVDAKFKGHTSFSRHALVHFLLSNMGYDIRLAEAESGVSLILLPFNQMVYSRNYLNIDNKKYFVFSDSPLNQNESIYTCFLPADLLLGDTFELKLNELNLPYKPYKYHINYGDITLTGEVNANIYPILYHYPQMPIGDYAQSVVSSPMRRSIVAQMKDALKYCSPRESAEKMLNFTQFAFAYATDYESHGFEKPYFFEEIVYYPKCDCEDRAIFYSYLLYNVAGIENHVISYPGHEATALTLPVSDLKGTSYTFDNKLFYISDPTYIGASVGMCMPDFEHVTPAIDFVYK